MKRISLLVKCLPVLASQYVWPFVISGDYLVWTFPILIRASYCFFPEYSRRRASGPDHRLETHGVSPSCDVRPRSVLGRRWCRSVLLVVFPPTDLEPSVAKEHFDPTRPLLCGMLSCMCRRRWPLSHMLGRTEFCPSECALWLGMPRAPRVVFPPICPSPCPLLHMLSMIMRLLISVWPLPCWSRFGRCPLLHMLLRITWSRSSPLACLQSWFHYRETMYEEAQSDKQCFAKGISLFVFPWLQRAAPPLSLNEVVGGYQEEPELGQSSWERAHYIEPPLHEGQGLRRVWCSSLGLLEAGANLWHCGHFLTCSFASLNLLGQ